MGRKKIISVLMTLIFIFTFIFSNLNIEYSYAASYNSGYYVTIKDNVPYWSKNNSSSTKKGYIKSKNTTVYIESIKKNSEGNYWGYVGSYGYKGYVYLGNFKVNSHPYTDGYYTANVNTVYKKGNASKYTTLGNIKSGTTVYIKNIKRNSGGNHWGYVDGKGYVFLGHFNIGPYSSGYYVTIKDNVPYWSKNNSSSTKKGYIKSKNTTVYIESIKKNSEGNYWGYVGSYGYKGYVYLGNFKVNSHSYSNAHYTATVDTVYKKGNASKYATLGNIKKGTTVYVQDIKRNSGGNHWGYVSHLKGYVFLGHFKDASYSYANGYYTATINTVYRKGNAAKYDLAGDIKKGTTVYVQDIKRNSGGNHWGYVSHQDAYVYLGHFNKGGTPAKVTSVKLNKTSLNLQSGKNETLKVTIAPSNASNQNVTWVSSNKKVATVNNGKVTAVAPGSTTITATAKDGSKKYATCKVTVINKTKGMLAVEEAKKHIGKNYVYGANPILSDSCSNNSKFDCSSLVQHCYYKVARIKLPRTSRDQYSKLKTTISKDKLQAGDLLFFKNNKDGIVSHVAMYMGDGNIIHAASTKSGIKIENFSKYCNNIKATKYYAGARRPY